jgi:SAM-dependent methyltransferase
MLRLESSSKVSRICKMKTHTEGQYLFPHSWEGEGERLTSLASAFDPITRRHIAPLGLAPGWRCLEVGAGTGSIARWLSEVVGPKGRVLATDLSLELMQGLEGANLELRQHDIVRDPLPEGEFDLVHCRLVLEHLPGRLDALAKMARALAPGGWLVVEDFCFRGRHATDRRGAVTIGTLLRFVSLVMQQNGWDPKWAPRLPIHLRRAGLTEVGAEGTQPVLLGASRSVDWALPSLARMRALVTGDGPELSPSPVQKVMAAAPPVRRLITGRLDGLERLLADPEFCYVAPTFVSAWGRRPLEA